MIGKTNYKMSNNLSKMLAMMMIEALVTPCSSPGISLRCLTAKVKIKFGLLFIIQYHCTNNTISINDNTTII